MCGGTLVYKKYSDDSFEIKHIHIVNTGLYIKTEYFTLPNKKKTRSINQIIQLENFRGYIEDLVYNRGYEDGTNI